MREMETARGREKEQKVNGIVEPIIKPIIA